MPPRSDHGPARTHPGADLSAARRRVLSVVAQAEQDPPVTLAMVASTLGGHPNAARQHLDALVSAGLLSRGVVERAGPGRRPQSFSLTPAGQRALSGPASHELHEVVGAFASYLVASGDGEQAHAIGEHWAERHDPLPEVGPEGPVGALVEMLDILGFAPARTTTDDGEAVVLRDCPLLDLAHEHPDVICEMHRGLVDGVMHRLGATQGVRLLPFSEPDGCRVDLG